MSIVIDQSIDRSVALALLATPIMNVNVKKNLNGHGHCGRCGSYGPVIYTLSFNSLCRLHCWRGIIEKLYHSTLVTMLVILPVGLFLFLNWTICS